jgi:hypothetical protein
MVSLRSGSSSLAWARYNSTVGSPAFPFNHFQRPGGDLSRAGGKLFRPQKLTRSQELCRLCRSSRAKRELELDKAPGLTYL